MNIRESREKPHELRLDLPAAHSAERLARANFGFRSELIRLIARKIFLVGPRQHFARGRELGRELEGRGLVLGHQ